MGQGFGIAMSCGVGHRHGLDLALLWLWCRAVAVALIRPLAWEPPYATGAALKKKKKKKDKKTKHNKKPPKNHHVLITKELSTICLTSKQFLFFLFFSHSLIMIKIPAPGIKLVPQLQQCQILNLLYHERTSETIL